VIPARGNAELLLAIKAYVLRATIVLRTALSIKAFIVAATLMFVAQAWAFPMKPDVKALIQEAKQPQQHFVPARAGWNGPEEASQAALNPTLEDLRREPTPAQRRARLIAAATPDWRVLAAIALCIGFIRVSRKPSTRSSRPATILPFPTTVIAKPAEISDAA
jgi:hypothetical protein